MTTQQSNTVTVPVKLWVVPCKYYPDTDISVELISQLGIGNNVK